MSSYIPNFLTDDYETVSWSSTASSAPSVGIFTPTRKCIVHSEVIDNNGKRDCYLYITTAFTSARLVIANYFNGTTVILDEIAGDTRIVPAGRTISLAQDDPIGVIMTGTLHIFYLER